MSGQTPRSARGTDAEYIERLERRATFLQARTTDEDHRHHDRAELSAIRWAIMRINSQAAELSEAVAALKEHMAATDEFIATDKVERLAAADETARSIVAQAATSPDSAKPAEG